MQFCFVFSQGDLWAIPMFAADAARIAPGGWGEPVSIVQEVDLSNPDALQVVRTVRLDADGRCWLESLAIPGRLELGTLSIAPDDRLLVTGPNGAGKSTLLSVLAGDLPGAVRRKGLRVGLLRQDVRFADTDETPREIYRRSVGERRSEMTPLGELGLLSPAQLDRPVGSMSVGQQRRLALAVVIANPPHLFLLDEPSNHLSLSLSLTVELEEALQSYPGAVVVASHDRWLRQRWKGRAVHLDPAPARG